MSLPGRAPAAVAVLLAMAPAAACADSTGPRLVSVTPAAAARNGQVVLAGERLCGPSGDCANAAGQVQIGLELPAVRAMIVSYQDTTAEIVIPPSAPVGKTSLVVTVNDHASNALDFEVLP